MTLGISMIAWTAIMLASGFIWSRIEQRKKREKFKRELQGYKFGNLQELKDYWRGSMDIGISNKEFDEHRHGNLLETLRVIDEDVRKAWIIWNS